VYATGESGEFNKDFGGGAPKRLIMNALKGYYSGRKVNIPDMALQEGIQGVLEDALFDPGSGNIGEATDEWDNDHNAEGTGRLDYQVKREDDTKYVYAGPKRLIHTKPNEEPEFKNDPVIDVTKKYMTRNGGKVEHLTFSKSDRTSAPVMGTIRFKGYTRKKRYTVWSPTGLWDTLWGRNSGWDLVPAE